MSSLSEKFQPLRLWLQTVPGHVLWVPEFGQVSDAAVTRNGHHPVTWPQRSRQFHGAHDVAAQVAFESKGLKPGFHFIGSRVETRRAFKLPGNPHHDVDARRRAEEEPVLARQVPRHLHRLVVARLESPRQQ
jgi:hypothetical protein